MNMLRGVDFVTIAIITFILILEYASSLITINRCFFPTTARTTKLMATKLISPFTSSLACSSSSSSPDKSSTPPRRKDDDNDTSSIPIGFNPFEGNRGEMSSYSSLVVGKERSISLRSMRMKQLMDELLRIVQSNEPSNEGIDEDTAVKNVFKLKSKFILEPLEEENDEVGSDSIYDPNMTREERYDRYNDVISERMNKAKDSAVYEVLQLIRDYVASNR